MRQDIIQDWAAANHITISNEQFEQLAAFQQMVLDTNAKMNLTRITDDTEFAIKHIIDSMTLLPYIPQQSTVLDIGTGVGFPGVVLGIMRPDIQLSLLDSLKKRVQFLESSLDKLGIHAECIPVRAEEWARTGAQYEICTARAVAKMDKLVKYTLPLIRTGGSLLAMKGPDVTEELDLAKKSLTKLGGVIKNIDLIRLTDEITHSIIIIEKHF